MSRNEAQRLVDKMNLVLKTTPFPKAVMLDTYYHALQTLHTGGWKTRVVKLVCESKPISATMRLTQ